MCVNVGIRRRLAPLMENSRSKIELITFLLMTMPGAPIVYYGDEIGMGDNIYLGDRNGVRAPLPGAPRRHPRIPRPEPAAPHPAAVQGPGVRLRGVNRGSQLRSPYSLL